MRWLGCCLFLFCFLVGPVRAQDEPRVRAIKLGRRSVVSVRTWKDGTVRPGVGSGIILRQDGFILTNAHVVEGAKVVKITLLGKQTYNAKIWKVAKEHDLALLKIEATGLTPASIADSDRVQLGQTAIAIGDPMGFEGTVTTGTVSGMGRDVKAGGVTYQALIQTDAAISPGSSGGALIDLDGKVIGVNTLVYLGTSHNAQGLGFAIPINHAIKVARTLVAARPPGAGKPWIGIEGINLTPELAAGHEVPAQHGVVITRIVPGSPAEQANLQVGDAITNADGKTVLNIPDFTGILNSHKPGETVSLSVWRQGKKMTIQVTLEVQSQ